MWGPMHSPAHSGPSVPSNPILTSELRARPLLDTSACPKGRTLCQEEQPEKVLGGGLEAEHPQRRLRGISELDFPGEEHTQDRSLPPYR